MSPKFRELADGDAFLLSEQCDLTIKDFNPFKISVSTSQKTEKDTNFGSIATLLDALQKMAEGAGASGAPQNTRASMAFNRGRLPAVADDLRTIQVHTPLTCEDYAQLTGVVAKLDAGMRDPIITATDVGTWVDVATSAAGVKAARVSIASKVKDLSDNVKILDDIDTAIRDKFLPAADTAEKFIDNVNASPECAVKPVALALVYDTARHLASTLDAKRALIASLNDLNKRLEKYQDSGSWRSGSSSEYIFLKPTPDFDNVTIISVTVTTQSITVDSTPSLKVEDIGSVTHSIRIRLYSSIIPELSGAVIKTDLKFPKYGLSPDSGSGKQKIVPAGEDDFPASGAIALNGICRCGMTSFVYPMLQLGVTNSKDYPGFIVGGGLRFTNPRSLSVVAGYIYTWYQGLVGKNVGDLVDGTADLTKAMGRRSKRGSYVGIQYSF